MGFVLALIFAVIVLGILFFAFSWMWGGTNVTAGRGPVTPIQAGQSYYISGLRQNTFICPHTGTPMNLVRADRSYLQFDNDFRIATVRFTAYTAASIFEEDRPEFKVDFVVTHMRRLRNGHMRAELVNIVNGRLVRFNLTTNRYNIIITADVTFTVRVETERDQGGFIETIERHSTVLMFCRGGQEQD